MAKQAWLWYSIAIVIVALDLMTKSYFSNWLTLSSPPYPLIEGYFDWNLSHNYGAAWSIFADMGGSQRWFLSILAAVVSVILIVWVARVAATNRWEACALALVLGGALGNLYDRVTLGYVVDFISVHYRDAYYFPVFNIADTAISAGAVMIIIDLFRRPDDKTSDKE